MYVPTRFGWRVLSCGLASCLVFSSALAQQTQQNQAERQGIRSSQPRATSQARNQSQSGEVERFLASCLLDKNQAEVEISQLAKDKSENEQVRQFAQQVIDDHRQMTQKLQQIAGKESGMPGQSRIGQPGISTGQSGALPDQTSQPQPGQSQAGQLSNRTSPQGGAGPAHSQQGAFQELTSIEKQITEQATNDLRQKLQEKSGAEFDQCYLGFQVGLHSQLKAALEVIGQQTSGQLQQFAQTEKSTVEEHLQKAEKLMQEGSSQSSRTGGTAARTPATDESDQFSR